MLGNIYCTIQDVANFYIFIFLLQILGGFPLVSTLVCTQKLEFSPNSLRMTPESKKPFSKYLKLLKTLWSKERGILEEPNRLIYVIISFRFKF